MPSVTMNGFCRRPATSEPFTHERGGERRAAGVQRFGDKHAAHRDRRADAQINPAADEDEDHPERADGDDGGLREILFPRAAGDERIQPGERLVRLRAHFRKRLGERGPLVLLPEVAHVLPREQRAEKPDDEREREHGTEQGENSAERVH